MPNKTSGQSYDLLYYLKMSWRYAKPYKPLLAAIFVCQCFTTVFIAAIPLWISILVDQAIGKGNEGLLWALIAIAAVAFLVVLAAQVLSSKAYGWIESSLSVSLKDQMFTLLQDLSDSFYRRSEVGDLQERVMNNAQAVVTAFQQVLIQGPMIIIGFAISFAIIIHFSWKITPIILVGVLYQLVNRQFNPKIADINKHLTDLLGGLNSFLGENLRAQPAIRSYTLKGYAVDIWQIELEKFRSLTNQFVTVTTLASALNNTIGNFIALATYAFGGWLIIHHSFTLGALLALVPAITNATAPIQQFYGILQSLSAANGSMRRIDALMAEKPEISDDRATVYLEGIKQGITFTDVSLVYPQYQTNGTSNEHLIPSIENGAQGALSQVSFTVRAGEKVAIVGESGSGKTTIRKALTREYNVTAGQISIDGIPIDQIFVRRLRQLIAVSQADPFCWSTDLARNVLNGRGLIVHESKNPWLRHPDQKDLEDAARAIAMAGLHEKVMSLPQQYETHLGPDGMLLSTGERKRLEIARALFKVLRDAQVLILDEPTANLDAGTAQFIYSNLFGSPNDKTILLITHQLTNIPAGMRILVMDKGHLEEEGTHEELMAKSAVYARMYQQQFRLELEPAIPA